MSKQNTILLLIMSQCEIDHVMTAVAYPYRYNIWDGSSEDLERVAGRGGGGGGVSR